MKFAPLSQFIELSKNYIILDESTEYKRVKVRLHRKGIVLRDYVKGFDIKTKKQQICKTDQLLVAEIDAKVGGYGIVPKKLEGAIVSNHYFLFNIDTSKLLIEYLFFLLKTDTFFSQIKAKGSTNYASIRPNDILKIRIPYDTVSKQKKMIEGLEKFSQFSMNLEKTMSENLNLISSLRQSILQEAVKGKLTADWRKENPDVEPASELLKRIKAEKEKLIKEKKIKKQKPLPPITKTEIPFELPEEWEWCRLGEISVVNPRNKIEDNLDCSFIPMRFISEKYGIAPEFEIRKWFEIKSGFTHFANNDVVIAKITPCFENSKVAIMKNLKNGFGAGTTELHVLRAILITTDFVYIVSKTSGFLKEGKKQMTGTAGQQRVPKSFIENYTIAIPPLQEQNQIITKVDKLMQLCDELEDNIKQSKEYSEQLMEAVLREAFDEKDD